MVGLRLFKIHVYVYFSCDLIALGTMCQVIWGTGTPGRDQLRKKSDPGRDLLFHLVQPLPSRVSDSRYGHFKDVTNEMQVESKRPD